jgi:transposase
MISRWRHQIHSVIRRRKSCSSTGLCVASARAATGHSVARKKSDAGDALVLAHILRTDQHAHRPLPADSELAQAIAVLARAQQDAVWDRTCAHNKLRSLLREY